MCSLRVTCNSVFGIRKNNGFNGVGEPEPGDEPFKRKPEPEPIKKI